MYLFVKYIATLQAIENIEDVNQILSSSLNSEEDQELEKDLEELLGESNKNPVKKNKISDDENLLESLRSLMVDDLGRLYFTNYFAS